MVVAADIKWTVTPDAKADLEGIRTELGDATYREHRQAIQKFLVNYFNAEEECKGKQGNSISPVGSTAGGGKILKVRWGVPGGGQSGGLRLGVVVYCDEYRVAIARAFLRPNTPKKKGFWGLSRNAVETNPAEKRRRSR